MRCITQCTRIPTCENKNPKVFKCSPQKKCRPKCVCKKGYLWSEKWKKCVPPSKCEPDHKCKLNEVFKPCISPCAKIATCQNRKPSPPPEVCTAVCKPKCVCKPNYIWDEKKKKCVLPSECEADHKKCKPNEEFNPCTSACAKIPTCRNPHPGCDLTKKCTKQCVPRCLCKKGLIRNDLNGKCVRRHQCPRHKQPIKE